MKPENRYFTLLIDSGKNIQPELYKDIWDISRVRVNVAAAVKVNYVLM